MQKVRRKRRPCQHLLQQNPRRIHFAQSGGSSGTSSPDDEESACHANRKVFRELQLKGCELIGEDAGALADKFSNTAEFSAD
jgi:hypothetical protein